jgi:hypothetical protein
MIISAAIGSAFIHCAMNAKSSDTKREALTSISSLISRAPKTMPQIMREGVLAWLQSGDYQTRGTVQEADDDNTRNRSQSLGRILSAIFVRDKSSDKDVLNDLAVEYLILTHHPDITADAQISWIELVRHLGLDATHLLLEKRSRVLKLLSAATAIPVEEVKMAQAAYRAATTLCFIQPSVYVPPLLEMIREDLDASALHSIGAEEIGIWRTPPGQTFVDGGCFRVHMTKC